MCVSSLPGLQFGPIPAQETESSWNPCAISATCEAAVREAGVREAGVREAGVREAGVRRRTLRCKPSRTLGDWHVRSPLLSELSADPTPPVSLGQLSGPVAKEVCRATAHSLAFHCECSQSTSTS